MTSAIIALITAILPAIIKLFVFFIDRSNASNEDKKKFIATIESMKCYAQDNIKLMNDYDQARENNLKKIQEMNQPKI